MSAASLTAHCLRWTAGIGVGVRKASGKLAAEDFLADLDGLDRYVDAVKSSNLSKLHISWAYEAALIKVAVAFEELLLRCLVACINRDTSDFSATTQITFPKHLSKDVCQYLVTRNGYLKFTGSDPNSLVTQFLPKDHEIARAFRDPEHKQAVALLYALRNFAAHGSDQSKKKAREVVNQRSIGSAGAWVKSRRRFKDLTRDLRRLGTALGEAAPY